MRKIYRWRLQHPPDRTLDRGAEQEDHDEGERRRQQRIEPEPGPGVVGDEHAEHQELRLCEIHDAHHAEDQRPVRSR